MIESTFSMRSTTSRSLLSSLLSTWSPQFDSGRFWASSWSDQLDGSWTTSENASKLEAPLSFLTYMPYFWKRSPRFRRSLLGSPSKSLMEKFIKSSAKYFESFAFPFYYFTVLNVVLGESINCLVVCVCRQSLGKTSLIRYRPTSPLFCPWWVGRLSELADLRQ